MADSVADLTIRRNLDADLSETQLEELAVSLLQKRHELAERVQALEAQLSVKDDCSLADAADAASQQEGRLRAGGMVEQHRQVVGEIDAALRRLANGSYGVSEASGEPISYERLKLVPWARTGAVE